MLMNKDLSLRVDGVINVVNNRKQEITKMSKRENKESDSMLRARTVPDSVHQRLRHENVSCLTCQKNFPSSRIEEHFNSSHPSDDICVYCKGKKFSYTRFKIDADGNELAEDEPYHSCRQHGRLA